MLQFTHKGGDSMNENVVRSNLERIIKSKYRGIETFCNEKDFVYSTVRHYVNGYSRPDRGKPSSMSISLLFELANALEVNIVEFFKECE